MAGETLRDAAGLLAIFPDNTSGLIQAVHSRDFIVSGVNGIGFMEDDPADTPVTVPMVDGVPTDLLSQFTAPQFVGNFWQLDGNNAFIPDYPGVTIPPGTQRLVGGTLLIIVQKAGGGTADYEFQGTEGGITTGNPQVRTIGATESIEVFSGTRLYDVSIGGPISVDITPLGTSDDLIVSDLRVNLESGMI